MSEPYPLSTDADADRMLALASELRVLLSQLNRRLREQSHHGDFTQSQKMVLVRLERDGPATVTALARAEGVRPQSMGATVAALEAAGLVSGESNPADGRQTILSITAACRELIRTSRSAKEDWLYHALESKLTPGEPEALVGLLKRLIDL